MNLLDIRNVSKHYRDHTALDDISFSVPKGSIFGLLGPNGAGKTSLIRIINQITAPDGGQIYFNQELLQTHHVREIGYLPEERGLYKKMKVIDQLMYFARLKGLDKENAKNTIDHWLEKFEAKSWSNKKIEELSKGMQQKIQFIVTLLHSPSLIILDEPFTGFDPKNTELIKNEILRLRDEGTTVLLSTHRMESVEAICDEVAMINRSKLIKRGTVRSIREELKQGLYEVTYEGTHDTDSVSDITIKSKEVIGAETKLTFWFKEGIKPNIKGFQDQNINILSYREIIPSMQEVFLHLTESAHE